MIVDQILRDLTNVIEDENLTCVIEDEEVTMGKLIEDVAMASSAVQ